MPQWLPLRRGEVLPLFVNRHATVPENICTRANRRWRTIPRLKRTALLSLLAIFILSIYYMQLIYLSDEVDTAFRSNVRSATRRIELKNNSNVIVPVFHDPSNQRQKAVRDAFKHAWEGYRRYAWGHDHLKPLSHGYAEWMECGLTIVDSLDTLLIMNLKDEFADAKKWIEDSLNFDKDNFVNLFETSIRVLGGLLSAFHLTGDALFKNKALDVGERLLGAFNSSSAIPFSDVNLLTKSGKQPGWGGESSLSEVTSVQLEFRDLARITGIEKFEEISFRTSQSVHEMGCADHEGLCDMFLSPSTGKFRSWLLINIYKVLESTTITFGARSDSYYEYLLKQWLQTGKSIDWLRDDYEKSMNAMEKLLWRSSEPTHLGFVGELLAGETYSPKMDHLTCFLAGTLALGTANGLPSRHMDIAKNLSRTCFEMYRTATGLSPEIAYFNMMPGRKEDVIIKPLDSHSLLRPEAFEAWFYMFRLTGDKMYQDWGWQAFLAIEKYAKVEAGYSSVANCKKIPVSYRDMMESFFLSESLKYLYLLLADDQEMIPLDKYVLNTEGHPLPIRSY